MLHFPGNTVARPALSWAQVALASEYAHMAVALHKSVRRVYSTSPWNAENTMCAVYAITDHQPCAQHGVGLGMHRHYHTSRPATIRV